MSEPKKAVGNVTRRDFLTKAATVGAAVTIVPRHVLGRGYRPPSDLLNIASVGVGGMGRANMINLSSQNIVALCDVDWDYADKGFARLDADIAKQQERIDHPTPDTKGGPAPTAAEIEKMKARIAGMKRVKDEVVPKAKRYTDYREMLEKQKDIDAVVIATPDHMHATIALAAMDIGKHVYVQKPLTWSVLEARMLSKRATETKLATQMGNQGHSLNDSRTAVELIQSGAIGEVREIHIWTNRPIWPQGVPRPAAWKPGTTDSGKIKTSAPGADIPEWNQAGVNDRLAAAMAGDYPVPAKLSWDLFLGVAPSVPYHPIYHPFNWRGWVDWGVGAIGDMGAHLFDVSMWALKLGLPTSIETVSTVFNAASYPLGTMSFYEFPARGVLPAVKLTWYDGALMPATPLELGDEQMKKEGGALLIGSKGKLMHDTYGVNPRLLPNSLAKSVGKPSQKLPRIANEEHEMNWVDAAKGKTKASSPFEYAAVMTEVMLLGVVALRAGKKIEYDAANMRVTNAVEANQYLSKQNRTGW
jgi:predicted dehydrogenase